MEQKAVSWWFLTTASQVHIQVSPVGFVVDKVSSEQIFLRVLSFSFVNINPLFIHINLCIICKAETGPVTGSRSLRHSLTHCAK